MRVQKFLYFSAGIPGLPPELTRFALAALADDSPFFFLQSLQDGNVGFVLINPFAFFPGYEFNLPEEEAQALEITSPEQAAVFCVVNASRGLAGATVNLLAPLVVNIATGNARQVVLVDERYDLRHPLPQIPPKVRASSLPTAREEGVPAPGEPPQAPSLEKPLPAGAGEAAPTKAFSTGADGKSEGPAGEGS